MSFANTMPGDTVWLVTNYRAIGSRQRTMVSEVIVSKVGSKWVYYDYGHGRFDKETGAGDGGQYTTWDHFFHSRAEARNAIEADAAWREFAQLVSRESYPPKGVMASDIRRAARAIGLEFNP